MAYESTAPPLSYLANCVMMLTESAKKVNYFVAVPSLLSLFLHGTLHVGCALWDRREQSNRNQGWIFSYGRADIEEDTCYTSTSLKIWK